jgi:hypothetical protein
VDSAAALKVGVALEALLLQPMLQPMARQFDALGSYGIGLIAQRVAENDNHGFAELVARRLERTS